MRLLQEPLLHFLLAGSLLFGGYEWLNRGAPAAQAEGPVKIGDGQVRWLQETFANQWRRRPTGEEMHDLVDRLVEEELLAREAHALGLDQNDTIIRRRLAQKLTFLVEDTSRIADPGDDELRRFHAQHAARYRTEPLVSFAQIYFSAERRPHPEADARAALAALSASSERPPDGDPLLLEPTYEDVAAEAVTRLFGTDFAHAVLALPPGAWGGPVRSAFGIHLVLVSRLRPAEPRPFEDVRKSVMDDWRRQRESAAKAAYLAKLREKYGVAYEGGAKGPLGAEAAERPPS